jgi:hypothetical protein
MKIIFVSIGIFQEYVIDNIKQCKLHGNNDIVLLTEKKYVVNNDLNIEIVDIADYNTEYIRHFKNNLSLDKSIRNGFWYNCSLRFCYIYEYMRQNNITDIIHLENDVMIYENLDVLKDKFDNNKIYLTFDASNRVIPGIIYIPNHNIFKNIMDNYDMNDNDMNNLGKYFNSPFIEPFPIISINDNDNENYFNKNFKIFKSIFDGAAIGQYLGGVDKRNDINDTIGFINETCVIKYNNYKFYWKKINDLWCPYIEINNELIKIINLHIHSKSLEHFRSIDPIENQFILFYK